MGSGHRDRAARAALSAPSDDMRVVWEPQIEQLVAERKGLQRELGDAEESIARYRHATDYLRTIEGWCEAMGPTLLPRRRMKSGDT